MSNYDDQKDHDDRGSENRDQNTYNYKEDSDGADHSNDYTRTDLPSPYSSEDGSSDNYSSSYGSEANGTAYDHKPEDSSSKSDYHYVSPAAPPRKPRIFPYIAVSLISALLGGVLSLGLAPTVYGSRFNQESSTGSNAATTPITISTNSKSDTSSSSNSVAEIAKAVGPGVVGVANFQNQRGFFGGDSGLAEVGSGSGFVINAQKGYVVTNYHVIDGAEKITISLEDGRNLDAKVVGSDSRSDLAVLQIADTSQIKNLTQVQLGDSSKLQVGDAVVAIGNPGGEEFARSVTTGIVSALNRYLTLEGEAQFDLIQTDAAINPGNSGGPLINSQGQVIGINSAKNSDQNYEGMGFAIPSSEALPIINQLISKGYASYAGLGVGIASQYTSEYAQQKGLPDGAYVQSVSQGSPAGKAGIQTGDIITKINGETISTSLDLTRQLFKLKVGDTVKITYYHNGQTKEASVALMEIKSE